MDTTDKAWNQLKEKNMNKVGKWSFISDWGSSKFSKESIFQLWEKLPRIEKHRNLSFSRKFKIQRRILKGKVLQEKGGF